MLCEQALGLLIDGLDREDVVVNYPTPVMQIGLCEDIICLISSNGHDCKIFVNGKEDLFPLRSYEDENEDERGAVWAANNWRSQLAFLVKQEPC